MNNESKKKNRVVFIGISLILFVVLFTFVRPKLNFSGFFKKKKTISTGKPQPYNDVKFILSKELRDKITQRENLTMLDIRDSASFGKKHIEDSINVSPKNLEDYLQKTSKNNLIVIIGYDYEGKKEISQLVKKIQSFGFDNVVVLSGGINEWINEQNPTISGGDPNSSIDVSKISYILPEQVKLAVDNNYPLFIIDARPKLLYLNGHLPSAKNIPMSELEKRKNEISGTDEIVVYTDNELNDFKASVKLYDLGFLANYIMKGGLKEWKNKGYDLVK